MVEKIKKLLQKVRNKVTEPDIRNAIIIGTVSEFIIGFILIMITDNIVISILAGVALFIGVCAGCIVMLGLLYMVIKRIAFYLKVYSSERRYSVKKELKRINNIKKNNKNNSKIRVGFYCDGGQFWSTFCDVYERMLKDDRFETVVVASPETFRNEIYHYDALKFLDEKNIPYVKAYDEGKWLDFKTLKLDYFFYNRHYLGRQSKHSSFNVARKYSKICYVPYAICPQVGSIQDTLCNFEELRGFDFLFSENNMMTKIYTMYKNKFENVITRIETVGSPKFEYAVTNADKEPCFDKSKYVQSVLYTPRWCFSDGTSSFFELKDYFFELVSKNKNIEYIFRPHPLMKQAVEDNIGIEFWNEFIAEFDKYENAEVDFNTDYMASFSRASVLVSDLSTMMFEFSTTEKPVIYMYKVDKLNEFGKEASKGYYYCYNAEDVDKTLELLREGKDKFTETRKEISDRLYHNDGVSPAENICDIIIKDYEKLYNN